MAPILSPVVSRPRALPSLPLPHGAAPVPSACRFVPRWSGFISPAGEHTQQHPQLQTTLSIPGRVHVLAPSPWPQPVPRPPSCSACTSSLLAPGRCEPSSSGRRNAETTQLSEASEHNYMRRLK